MSAFTPTVALIQGASRGIGLGFVQSLLLNPTTRIIATCRNPTNSPALQSLLEKHKDRLTVLGVDVWKEEEIERAANVVKDTHGRVDFLVNSAGILNLENKGETSLRNCNPVSIQRAFDTNAIGPLLVAKHFAPLLAVGPKKAAQEKQPETSSVILNISARVGSIEDNRNGGWYAYRMSKAALNMATRTMAVELRPKKVICVAIHPGTVDTNFSKGYQKTVKHEIFTVEKAVGLMTDVVKGLKIDDTGKFLAYDGTQIPF
eukprot:comp15855_c0_seq1/m.13186 comp15855_c0_seq1/g.13186  ORF comp15855_c0_seq1/g.13186 comp15855_c0_seq1/m.13186 type:complete len:260 (-) comp15855_c0_seq1:302-1081(-)